MTRPVLVLATGNAGKVRELTQLLAAQSIELRDLRQFPALPPVEETGDTYRINAAAKAHATARFTGLAALADDSGLEVDALGGAPGVYSARFAGPQQDDRRNIALLLDRLRDVPADRRQARFSCVIVVARPDGRELVSAGHCDGVITLAPQGTGGFGYDPVFYHPGAGHTFAELSDDTKNRLSHRADACARLRSELPGFLADGAAADC